MRWIVALSVLSAGAGCTGDGSEGADTQATTGGSESTSGDVYSCDPMTGSELNPPPSPMECAFEMGCDDVPLPEGFPASSRFGWTRVMGDERRVFADKTPVLCGFEEPRLCDTCCHEHDTADIIMTADITEPGIYDVEAEGIVLSCTYHTGGSCPYGSESAEGTGLPTSSTIELFSVTDTCVVIEDPCEPGTVMRIPTCN